MKKSITIGLVLFHFSLIVAAFLYFGGIPNHKKPEHGNQEQTPTEQKAPTVKTYTMDEVAQHGSDPDNFVDCWTVVRGKVYDITEFIDGHPGGESIYAACGKDATDLFETRRDGENIIGSGTPHSSNARNILEKYYIGDLKQ